MHHFNIQLKRCKITNYFNAGKIIEHMRKIFDDDDASEMETMVASMTDEQKKMLLALL